MLQLLMFLFDARMVVSCHQHAACPFPNVGTECFNLAHTENILEPIIDARIGSPINNLRH